ncbi:MAG TPA: citrate transporter [Candidatus Anaerobiospirillum stercoravium]|nr:citrate transporter [Candidatus Anaerobiospirillum stercoravium]
MPHIDKLFKIGVALVLMALSVGSAYASGAAAVGLEDANGWLTTTTIYGIRYEMIIFALILVGVAIFYNKTMQVALIGLLALCFYKYEFLSDFSVINRLFGHVNAEGEWVKGSWNTYLNLLLMLPGFSILANIFEESKFPAVLPRYLPKGTAGAMVLLGFVFVLSTFLDNIAAAMIGCSMAATLYKNKVHIGYVAAICAASNAGGAGSVVGDTTTTLIWIYGKDPLVIAHAFLPAIVAFLVVAFFAGREQHRYTQDIFIAEGNVTVEKKRIVLVGFILAAAIFFNYFFEFPALGIWIVILLGSFFVKINFRVGLTAMNSTIFLVALVFCAELVPIDSVPDASILSTLAIGFVSAVFNNIPLTQLCLIKGGYDWALISYAVGFGGSMVWFGSSAGVAVCDMFPKARSFMNWLRYGWHIPFGFVIGFGVYLLIIGWDPMKGNPPDQMPQPITQEEAIGNAPVHHNADPVVEVEAQ